MEALGLTNVHKRVEILLRERARVRTPAQAASVGVLGALLLAGVTTVVFRVLGWEIGGGGEEKRTKRRHKRAEKKKQKHKHKTATETSLLTPPATEGSKSSSAKVNNQKQ